MKWVGTFGVTLPLFIGSLIYLTPDLGDQRSTMIAFTVYFAGFFLLWLALSIFAFRVVRGFQAKHSMWIILAVAAITRVLVAGGSEPTLSDDIWRYIFDGQMLGVEGRNPYVLSPDDAGTDWPVNHPHLVTIYQPTSQWVFAGLASLPGDPAVTFRLGFCLFDLGIIALLLLAVRQSERSVWWVVLYAWHPLAISETAGSGHQDVIGIFFMVAALLAAGRREWWGAILCGLSMGLAIGVKPVVLPLLLPIAWNMRHDLSRVARLGSAVAVCLMGLYLPFALMDGGLTGMIETGRTFVDKWAFNAVIHPALTAIFGGKMAADVICAGLLITLLILAMRFSSNVWTVASVYLLGSLLLSTTIHPWYLLWALAVLPMAFSFTGWVWSLSIMLAYTAWLNREEFQPFGIALCVEYGLVAAAMIADLTGWARARWAARR